MTRCLGCNHLEPGLAGVPPPVQLHDGATVCASCPAYLDEVLVRDMLAKPLHERRRWLEEIERRRNGLERANELRELLKAVWAADKEKAAQGGLVEG